MLAQSNRKEENLKRLILLLLLPLLACEVADHDHPLHTEGAFIVEIDPPVSVIYDTKDDHITSQLYEAFKGIPPRAIHLENGDWRTVTVTFLHRLKGSRFTTVPQRAAKATYSAAIVWTVPRYT